MIHFYQFTIIIATNAYQPKLENIPYSDMFITHGRITMILKICMDLLFFSWNADTSDWEMCDKCQRKRPKRAHHCRRCQQCVVRMDHHCPWWVNISHGFHWEQVEIPQLPLQKIILFYFYIKCCKIWGKSNPWNIDYYFGLKLKSPNWVYIWIDSNWLSIKIVQKLSLYYTIDGIVFKMKF